MKIAIIYLAAGSGSRFGSNKLLYPLNQKPLYRHLLDRLAELASAHAGWQVIVVTRYPEIAAQADSLAGEQKLPVKAVLCPESRLGVSHTIRAGIQASPDAQAWAFFVADQPYLTMESARNFLEAMHRRMPPLGCVVHNGENGNPAWFDSSCKEELLALTGDQGGRRIIRRRMGECVFYEIEDGRELCDIDWRDEV